jgi:ubiquinone/menaquinone biosynthesis C-methylase UbiE
MTQRDFDIAIRERFDRRDVAAEYVKRKNRPDDRRNRREMTCIERALAGIEPGSRVLDLPTGAGRLVPMLLNRGYSVLAADYSEHMLVEARRFADQVLPQADEATARVEFRQEDIMHISLSDRSVDVSISNRLFHHYPTGELRRRALSELARVTTTRVIVSYFSNVALSALRFHGKNLLLNRTPTDRIPIWPSVFLQDVEAAGLRLEATYPVRYGFSPQTYLQLAKTEL